jgi:NADPH-dependent 2,4-dienoyl-CoA reductase/sulfur reductase-like enzyme
MGAIHKRDLRSDHSIWQRRPLPGVTEKRLARDTRCDVLIVGVGIGGALAAEQLTEAAPRSRN